MDRSLGDLGAGAKPIGRGSKNLCDVGAGVGRIDQWLKRLGEGQGVPLDVGDGEQASRTEALLSDGRRGIEVGESSRQESSEPFGEQGPSGVDEEFAVRLSPFREACDHHVLPGDVRSVRPNVRADVPTRGPERLLNLSAYLDGLVGQRGNEPIGRVSVDVVDGRQGRRREGPEIERHIVEAFRQLMYEPLPLALVDHIMQVCRAPGLPPNI